MFSTPWVSVSQLRNEGYQVPQYLQTPKLVQVLGILWGLARFELLHEHHRLTRLREEERFNWIVTAPVKLGPDKRAPPGLTPSPQLLPVPGAAQIFRSLRLLESPWRAQKYSSPPFKVSLVTLALLRDCIRFRTSQGRFCPSRRPAGSRLLPLPSSAPPLHPSVWILPTLSPNYLRGQGPSPLPSLVSWLSRLCRPSGESLASLGLSFPICYLRRCNISH